MRRLVIVKQWAFALWWLYIWVGGVLISETRLIGTPDHIATLDLSGFLDIYAEVVVAFCLGASVYYPFRWLFRLAKKWRIR